jgi:hypothetical protein
MTRSNTHKFYVLLTLHFCVLYVSENKKRLFTYTELTGWCFYDRDGCVYFSVRTGSFYIIQVMCFVWIWEQTAIISLYRINRLVIITETEGVYCAVRTGSLYIIRVFIPAIPTFRFNVAAKDNIQY